MNHIGQNILVIYLHLEGTSYQEQLSLALYWAITTDKSQGQSIKKAVIDLGKFEATARLAFGCLSRAKRLVDLLVEPMPFDRLSKLGDKPTLNIKLGSAP